MEDNGKPKCPKCGQPLIKNGKRSNDRQRWKCKNKACRYYITDGAKTNSIKINAINFFVDFLYNSLQEVNFKQATDMQLNLKKTKFKNDKTPELKIKEITDVRKFEDFDASKTFIIQLNKNSVNLVSVKLAGYSIRFENPDLDKSRKYKNDNI